ncbi:thiopurine S-methyltransferase [Sedimenticola thiotaurini]|uniref:Thiopurine S-methyltransferase n=1 Tax=Sedimenticola thiotaurini TaxID=1543721 RepID=A0A0F7JU95_9GAMM|nr:thiopurine S-methyltransferase [Sedimenticola thiotaurini]AKH20126.1 thiopurine S-methyltransferase [Sedimenticola thiotaurini]
MDKQFWHERWEKNQIGFHQQEINSYLQEYWSRLQLPAGSTVFVPLCGKSRDMLWLLEQGYRVLGIELSPIAVADFFRENNLQPEVRSENGMEHWSCDELEIICGDFFSLQPSAVAHCQAVYDRASLIAMPPRLRPAYADKLQSLCPTALPILLVTMEYPQEQMAGPPFSVHQSEVNGFYADRYDVENILTRDILDESPRFRQRGLTAMQERVYLLHPHPV